MGNEKFHDRGYKALFSHPQMVKELISSFVNEDFIKKIDFTTLKQENASFITDDHKSSEADIIWKVDIQGKPAFIYILIEFQSTVDLFMSVRMLTYILLLYQHIIKKERLKKLPSVFPVLLYSGDDKWTAPLELNELIDIPFAELRKYIPQFRYYKIAENEFTPEGLMELDNLVSSLFLIETANPEDLSFLIVRILKILSKEVDIELKRSFSLWLNAKLRIIDVDLGDIKHLDKGGDLSMLETKLKKYRDGLLEEGMQKGKLEGKLEGIIESARKMLEYGIKIEEIVKITGLSKEEILGK